MTIQVQEHAKLLREMSEGITQAIGAATLMVHAHQNPQWFVPRQALELTKERLMHEIRFPTKKVIYT